MQLCGQTRIGARILGNTIGNAVANGMVQYDNTATQPTQTSQAERASKSGTASSTQGTDAMPSLVTQGASDSNTHFGQIIVSGQMQPPEDNSSLISANYMINPYRHNPSYIAHRIFAPFPILPLTDGNVFHRSLTYSNMSMSLNSPGSVYNSYFFSAAADVTDLLGLTGAQSESYIGQYIPIPQVFDPITLHNIQDLGAGLYKNVNRPTFYALYNGDDQFRIGTGETIGSLTLTGTRDLDFALVHNEQTYVQKFINKLSYDQANDLIKESTYAVINLSPPNGVVANVLSNLGHPFNFGNQADREAIGRALVVWHQGARF